jgi:type I restriction enzyme S subunit
VARLRELILSLAVRGKLVPQDPSDEPASVLLERIRMEKTRLVAEGKIRREKPLAAIAEGEKPYKLPMGWEWSCLSTVGTINPRNEASDFTPASFVQMSSIPSQLMAPHQMEERPWGSIKSGFTHFSENDVGLAKITPCFENGKSTIFRNLANGIGAGTTELHVVRPLDSLNSDYVLIFLKSPDFIHDGEAVMTGSAGQKRVPRVYFESKPFPVPPLAEQSRIVTRVEQLRRLCADLRARLGEARVTQSRLAETLVEQTV